MAASRHDLSQIYLDYITCLNQQDWSRLGQFVDADAIHNNRPLGLSGYREMLERDFQEIPDLQFNIDVLVASATHVASRLAFKCSPRGLFLGLPVNGARVSFAENVFYKFQAGRIIEVWSVIDKAAIESQLATTR